MVKVVSGELCALDLGASISSTDEDTGVTISGPLLKVTHGSDGRTYLTVGQFRYSVKSGECLERV